MLYVANLYNAGCSLIEMEVTADNMLQAREKIGALKLDWVTQIYIVPSTGMPRTFKTMKHKADNVFLVELTKFGELIHTEEIIGKANLDTYLGAIMAGGYIQSI